MPLNYTIEFTEDMKLKVVQFVRSNGQITNKDCRQLLDLGYDQVIMLFNKMIQTGELVREGKTSSIRYVLPSINNGN